jgi:hypothetical protein
MNMNNHVTSNPSVMTWRIEAGDLVAGTQTLFLHVFEIDLGNLDPALFQRLRQRAFLCKVSNE